MAYLVLARKWRPQTFEEIRGQAHIVRALQNGIVSGRIAHAYLFTGIRGVGKTSAARVLAKALNCASGPTPTPCNGCAACQAITGGTSPDVFEIDGASNNGVEDVRSLREAVRYPPVQGNYRVYIIDEVHMLSTAAFNALLKTLEEPPEHVVFVFATTDPHKVPATVTSRCQQFDFKRLSSRELMGLLGDIAVAEGIAVDPKGLAALAREADGSVRDAQSLLDQVISYAGDTVRYEDVRDVLGVVDRELVLGVARAVLERDPRRVVEAVAEAERFGYDARRFAQDLLDLFRDLAVLRAVPESGDLVDLTPEEVAEVHDFLDGVSWEDVHARFDMLARGLEALRAAHRPGTVLEMTLLKLALLPALLPVSRLLEGLGDGPVPAVVSAPPSRNNPARELRRALDQPAAGQDDRAGPARREPDPPAPPRASPAPEEGPPPAPTRATGSAEPEDPGPAAAGPGGPPATAEALWTAFLAEIERENRPVWNVLREHGRLGSWDAATGRAVVVYDDPDLRFFFSSKQGPLTEALRRVAGPKARVELESGEPAASRPDPRRESDRARHLKRAALDHPLVRDAVEIFDGDVEEVRVLKP